MGTKPIRIQLKRTKGWRIPENTVKVDRTTKWGNPFIVGKHGDAEYCLTLFHHLTLGHLCISMDTECANAQEAFLKNANKNIGQLRGKNLACWCKPGALCHADILLELANHPARMEANPNRGDHTSN